MDTTKWKEIERLFFELVELPLDQQHAQLAELKASRPDVYQEVNELIEEEQRLHPMLKTDFPQSWHEWKDMDLEGKQIGVYRLSKMLGSGGMGSVFLGERVDGNFDQTVALKLINEGIYGEQSLAFFKRERQILAKLRHPNIASLLDGGVASNGRPYYTMEYIDGVPITVYCTENHCTLNERLDLFTQICDAVQYAHSQLVLHLDLKPSNILVDHEGRVKLMDFGIAQLIQPEERPGTSSEIPVKRYTLAYASPEQILGDQLSTVSDVYALGVILYELLTEVHPFEVSTSDPMTLRSDILNKPPVYPSEAISTNSTPTSTTPGLLSNDLDEICLKVLEKHPENRYPSVKELKDDIEAYRQDQPISLKKHQYSYVTGKFIKRNKLAVSLIITALLLLVGMGSYYTWQLGKEKNNALREATKANQMVTLLSGMFTQANPNVSLGEDITAKEMLELGASRFQKDLKDDPELLAEMYDILGGVYLDLANYVKADSFFKLGLEVKQQLSESPTPEQVMSYYYLGRINSSLGEFDSSIYYYQKVLELRTQFEESEIVSLSDVYYELSVIEGENGNYHVSDSLLNLTLKYRSNTQPDSFDALIFLSRGINSRKLRQYDTAKYYYMKSLDLRRELYPEVHPDVAHSLNHLSSLYQDMEQYDQALPYAQKSLSIRKRIFGDEHPESLASRANVARTYSRAGNYDQALAMYDTVYSLFVNVFGEEHHYLAGIAGSIGRIYIRMGDPQEAESYYRKSLDIALRALPEDHFNQAFSFFGLGQALFEQEKWEEAVLNFQEALRIRSLTLDPEHVYLIEAQTALGECLLKLDRIVEGKAFLSQAMQTLSKDPEGNAEEVQRIALLIEE